MAKVFVLTSERSTIDVDDTGIEEILSLQKHAFEIYEFVLQYSLFCKSLSEFKKNMYTRAIDLYQGNIEEIFKSSDSFVEAENSIMHISASFLKFTERLPSLLKKTFNRQPNIEKISCEKLKSLYDFEDGKYRLLCELRNAIVHNKVSIIVSSGASRKVMAPDGILNIGYYLDFDKFVENSVDKRNKKTLLLNVKSQLIDKKGNVDLVKLLSDVAKQVYLRFIEPQTSELKQEFAAIKRSVQAKIVQYEIVRDVDNVYIEYNGELMYSSSIIERMEHLINDIRAPITATSITLTPSMICN